ncbi:MAG: chemotaxis protein CheD [Marinilabiliaceae bacterium]|nr:chemotaxis protein CheD [Marinilabiliaceae bacterium]
MEYAQHFLYPSSLFASREPYVVKTVLGSCVAVCLWDKRLHFGGINHYMLPTWNGTDLASPKYGNIAIEKLIEKMRSLGSRVEDIQAKVFGGGELLDVGGGKSTTMIGERNIAIAKLLLEQNKIPIISSSVAGKRGRKILFFTDTGEVRHKFLDKREL